MKLFNVLVGVAIAIKVLFIAISLLMRVFAFDSKTTLILNNVRNNLEFIFILLSSIIVLSLVVPALATNTSVNVTNKELKILLAGYAFIVLLNADWHMFITNSYAFKAFNSIRTIFTNRT